MFGSEFCDFSFWWIFPVVMIALCFFMMRGRRGSMMCGFGSRDPNRHISDSDSPMEILEKRFALGELDQEAYEERKNVLTNRH
jgi:putative membrane protein